MSERGHSCGTVLVLGHSMGPCEGAFAGCQTLLASNLIEALRLASETPPSAVVIIDSDGIDAREAIGAFAGVGPVIVLSAGAQGGLSRMQALEGGADAFLKLPMNAEELRAHVNVAVRIKRMEKTLRNERDTMEQAVLKRTEELRRANRAIAALKDANHAIIHAEDEGSLLAEVCDIIAGIGSYAYAWAGHLRGTDEVDGFEIIPVARTRGVEFMPGPMTFRLLSVPEDACPAIRCVYTSRPVLVSDLWGARPYERWRIVYANQGFQSALAMPLISRGLFLGVLMICSRDIDAFGEEDVQLLKELSSDLSFGLSALRERIARREAVHNLKRSLEEKELLLKEVHHRVKNNMQIVSSLMSIQASYTDDARARELFSDCRHRVKAMGLIHERLYQSESFGHMDFRTYVETLCSYLVQTYSPGSNVALNVASADVRLDFDCLVPCGLIINELMTNALKHGVSGSAAPEIRVKTDALPDGRISIEVADNGPGLPEDMSFDKSGTLGFMLVRTLVAQLEGRIEFSGGPGCSVAITFGPVARYQASAQYR